jgi:hypothetical protein
MSRTEYLRDWPEYPLRKEEEPAYRRLAGTKSIAGIRSKSQDIVKRDGMLNLPRPLS